MAANNIPSFDLGFSDNEDFSHLIVEDSLDKDEDEVMSNNDGEVTTKETELSKGNEDGAYAANFKQDFDLNKVPDEDVNACHDAEETLKSDKVKNLRQKIVQPDEYRGVFDLNKLPNEGLDYGLDSEEVKKGALDILKIYIDSLY